MPRIPIYKEFPVAGSQLETLLTVWALKLRLGAVAQEHDGGRVNYPQCEEGLPTGGTL